MKAAWLFLSLVIKVGGLAVAFNTHRFFSVLAHLHTLAPLGLRRGWGRNPSPRSQMCNQFWALAVPAASTPLSLLLPRAQAHAGSGEALAGNGQRAENSPVRGYPAAHTDWNETEQLRAVRSTSGAGTGQQEQEVAAMAVPTLAKDALARSLNPTHARHRTSLKTPHT